MNYYKEKTLYPYVLDYKPGLFLSWILYKLLKKVSIEENMREPLKQMQKEGTVVYANKYSGLLDYIVYHYCYRMRRLPYPKIAFDLNISLILPLSKLFKVILSQISTFLKYGRIPSPYKSGYYKRAIQRRTTSLISLIDPKSFVKSFIYSRKDHLQFLLETQKEIDNPIFIIPNIIFFQKDPEKDYKSLSNAIFGYRDQLSGVRKLYLFFRNYRQAFIDFGTPLNLKSYLENQPPSKPIDDMSSEIRQILIERIDSQKRIIIGPIMKSRQQLKEMVLMDKRVLDQIERMASGEVEKLRDLRTKAGKYFNEIAADFSMAYVNFFRNALKWFWKKLYEEIEVDPEGSARVREWARKGSLVYIPSHKSHIDYLVLNNALFDHHMHIPRIAAGQNLAFWPVGHLFRKCGAFFIRRTFKGAKLYSEVFASYIKTLLDEGYPIEFYIEGGRSRNGKLVFPKIGFLSILLQAYRDGACNDLIFVPTSIIYDRVIEQNAYLKEMSGGTKEKESIRQVIKAGRFLKKRYGKIYIRFSEPLSLNEYLRKTDSESDNTPKELALHLVKAINDVTLVTPFSLVATAILSAHRRGFHIPRLIETVSVLLELLKKDNIPVADSLNDPTLAVQNTISLLTTEKVVDFIEDAPGDEDYFYYVDDDKKMELEYYKNNIIHFFLHHSLVAISFLTGTGEVKDKNSVISDYLFLKDLFENEFVFGQDEKHTGKILSIIQYFQESGFLIYSSKDAGYKLTKLGFDKLPAWAALVKTFLESYWIAAKVIGKQADNREKLPGLLKSMSYLGKQYHKLGVVDHIGALSQMNFRNAIRYIDQHILDDHVRANHYQVDQGQNLTQFTTRLYNLSHFGHSS
ncbi:1-acyl-sn-glycerol-3-phosphate acyltransferase [Thermodesulfobacteriota bacterium]